MIHTTANVSEGTNSNLPARNTLVQLSPVGLHPPWEPQCTALHTDRQKKDRQTQTDEPTD